MLILVTTVKVINPLIATLKQHSSGGPSYSNSVIGTLAIVGCAATFGTAWKGLGRTAAHPGPPCCTKCEPTSYYSM